AANALRLTSAPRRPEEPRRRVERIESTRFERSTGKAARLRHEHVLFLKKFLRAPIQIGAVAPSSAGLAELITADIGLEQARLVVELGPGTGAFTGAIERRMRPDAKLVAVEVDPVFART